MMKQANKPTPASPIYWLMNFATTVATCLFPSCQLATDWRAIAIPKNKSDIGRVTKLISNLQCAAMNMLFQKYCFELIFNL